MQKAKAHHFIPVGHLTRFSSSPDRIRSRDRTLHLYDKRSGSYRTAKVGKAAFENDLYTFRIPDMTGVEPDPAQLVRAIFDPANKDAEIESAKVEIEERGLAAMREIDSWPAGLREVAEDDRAPLLAYVGLLLAQHPTMMNARIAVVRERFWKQVEPWFGRPVLLRTMLDEMDKGMAAFAVVPDGLATALELNYLAWKVVRWASQPRLLLGDVGVAAWYPGEKTIGPGDVWTPHAKFLMPISPTSMVVLGGFAPGVCLVEERDEPDSEAEVDEVNVISWARSRAEVYAADRRDLERTAALLGPLDPISDHSSQLKVRASVLPDYEFDDLGKLHVIEPAAPDSEEVRHRWETRFATT
jgi:uncharacterized protein DUF4238